MEQVYCVNLNSYTYQKIWLQVNVFFSWTVQAVLKKRILLRDRWDIASFADCCHVFIFFLNLRLRGNLFAGHKDINHNGLSVWAMGYKCRDR